MFIIINCSVRLENHNDLYYLVGICLILYFILDLSYLYFINDDR